MVDGRLARLGAAVAGLEGSPCLSALDYVSNFDITSTRMLIWFATASSTLVSALFNSLQHAKAVPPTFRTIPFQVTFNAHSTVAVLFHQAETASNALYAILQPRLGSDQAPRVHVWSIPNTARLPCSVTCTALLGQTTHLGLVLLSASFRTEGDRLQSGSQPRSVDLRRGLSYL